MPTTVALHLPPERKLAHRGQPFRLAFTLTNKSNQAIQLYIPPRPSIQEEGDIPFQLRLVPLTPLKEPVQIMPCARSLIDLRKVYRVTLMPEFAISGYIAVVKRGGPYTLLPVGVYQGELWYDSHPLAKLPHRKGLWLGVTNTVKFRLQVLP